MRPLKNGNFCSSSRKAKISTTGIYRIFRGLKFESDAEIGQKVPFCKDLIMLTGITGVIIPSGLKKAIGIQANNCAISTLKTTNQHFFLNKAIFFSAPYFSLKNLGLRARVLYFF